MSNIKNWMNFVFPAAVTLWVAAPTVVLAQETYDIDPVHSTVIFRARHFGAGAVYGLFRNVSGTITMAKKASASAVQMNVDAASLYTGNKKRDTHLTGPDFLNAKQFPKISFQSTKVHRSGKTFAIGGKLSLHGVTKPVNVKMQHLGSAKDPQGKFRSGFEGTLTIQRSDFGITFMKGLVGEKIRLTIAVEGVRR